ncbi:hypothetical protein BC628DRAFT_1419700 [Trametes gibbosa]|nr:hypothetical protein BC628DRAFT_1419700 [Trametes gibbosa]UVI59147.1 Zn(2)-Cys(6)48 [Trametes gibbosa]
MSESNITIMFEHCTTRPGLPSATSSPSPASSSPPHTPSHPPDSGCAENDPAAADHAWNLIPYDVPWGPEYYDYHAGSLPGPDGACLFLRSPTPIKNRRTQKACNRCRQRKAKCSGDRPSCARCVARGYICEYAEEDKRPAADPSRSRHRDSHPRREPSEEPSDHAECSSPEGDFPPPRSAQLSAPRPVKVEPDAATPELVFVDSADTSDTASSSTAEYYSPWEDIPYHAGPAPEYASPSHSFGEPDYYDSPSYSLHAYHPQQIPPNYFAQHAPQHPAAAVHAPRPVRCTGSPPFLAQQAHLSSSCEPHIFAHDDMLIDFASTAESASQIALPQLPPMAPPAVHSGAFQYVHPQPMHGYLAPMPPYPTYLQYSYTVPVYQPSSHEGGETTMSYSLPAGTSL